MYDICIVVYLTGDVFITDILAGANFDHGTIPFFDSV